MQKRIVRKLDLERMLSTVKPHPTPRPDLEQYTITTDAAATMLYIAAYVYDGIVGKTVLDLGCGTGRLAIGAAFLGAKQVVGADVDRTAVKVAVRGCSEAGLRDRVQWVVADVDAVRGRFDTVVQNPPYGVQKRGADRKFLEKALETGGMVFSLHKSLHEGKAFIDKLKADSEGVAQVDPSPFLQELIRKHGGEIRAVYAMVMSVPRMFGFHTKRRHEFVADLYVVERRR